jgi:Ca2+-binding EF-hand superfamily protein
MYFIGVCSLPTTCDYRWLKQQFQEADVSGNGSLNYEESLKLLKQLNVKLPKETVKRLFDVGEGQGCWCKAA